MCKRRSDPMSNQSRGVSRCQKGVRSRLHDWAGIGHPATKPFSKPTKPARNKPGLAFASLETRGDSAMSDDLHFDDSADVLKDAHLRRSADLGRWLREFLQSRREE